MKTTEIRRRFLAYFEKHGHRIVEAGSLVPTKDPTLLFTNSGMNQFKDVFLGVDKRDYKRAVTAQRCVRAGGKHNDLENVGYTARHHTFFEMLGNFSFGDYFKRDAIKLAWAFITEELALPKERLWVTVYKDDDEAADIWLNEIGVDEARLSRLGDDDNFWMMGDVGPCGPCSEIFYDHGEEVPGGPPGSAGADLDRYIEIWNLVFMQYDALEDGTRVPLPKPSVDTGMGLERIAAILQGVHSNYEIDLFQALIKASMEITGCTDIENSSLRVIADHIRSSAFLIADGIVPANEGRGYVLRRIIRRAIRHGYKLNCKEPFLYRLVDELVMQMGESHPVLAEQADHVKKLLESEEQQFAVTISNGLSILEAGIERLSSSQLPGELVFKLYDTYGFPADLTADIARERGLTIDHGGFDQLMAEQRARAKAANNFKMTRAPSIDIAGETQFNGYDSLVTEAKLLGMFVAEQPVDKLVSGQEGIVILDQTSFYAESGGQVGDKGVLKANDGSLAEVVDCQKLRGHFLHRVTMVDGELAVGATVTGIVKSDERAATARHHSATHLLHAALIEVLGPHVKQQGSLVTHNRLRFDFTQHEPITEEQLLLIETKVNQQIMANTAVTVEVMDIEQAKSSGATALFGEKYGDQVRVLTMGSNNYSKELCGGTHVARTGDIGLLRIVSETGVAASVRRIEAVAGIHALKQIQDQAGLISQLQSHFKCPQEQVFVKVQQTQRRLKELEKEVNKLSMKLAVLSADKLVAEASQVANAQVLAIRLDNLDKESLKMILSRLMDQLVAAVVVIASVSDSRIQLLAGVDKAHHARFGAGDLVKVIGDQMGAKGGGRLDVAMAGGGEVMKIVTALDAVEPWVATKLS